LLRNDPTTRVLLATDAAGEGVNLQNANLMVNYDLPWNPNRLEQRFGRIHRIGQTEVCHLWNMVAAEIREGDVFQRLFEKLEVEREALGGRVFDIPGEVFEDKSLKDHTAHLEHIIQRNALCEEVMSTERLFAVEEELDRPGAGAAPQQAQARRGAGGPRR
jgi:superfamily II DNA/RNA helicase